MSVLTPEPASDHRTMCIVSLLVGRRPCSVVRINAWHPHGPPTTHRRTQPPLPFGSVKTRSRRDGARQRSPVVACCMPAISGGARTYISFKRMTDTHGRSQVLHTARTERMKRTEIQNAFFFPPCRPRSRPLPGRSGTDPSPYASVRNRFMCAAVCMRACPRYVCVRTLATYIQRQRSRPRYTPINNSTHRSLTYATINLPISVHLIKLADSESVPFCLYFTIGGPSRWSAAALTAAQTAPAHIYQYIDYV